MSFDSRPSARLFATSRDIASLSQRPLAAALREPGNGVA